MSSKLDVAKRCFLEARTPYVGSTLPAAQEKYNLLTGLLSLADAMEEIQNQLNFIGSQLGR